MYIIKGKKITKSHWLDWFNFRVKIPETSELKGWVDETHLISPCWWIIEIVVWENPWEQYFTYEAAVRELDLVNKRLPTMEELELDKELLDKNRKLSYFCIGGILRTNSERSYFWSSNTPEYGSSWRYLAINKDGNIGKTSTDKRNYFSVRWINK